MPVSKSFFFNSIFLFIVTCSSGCTVLGSNTIYSSRSAYNEAVARTSAQQILLNLVRLRYRDNPAFLQVGSIATQYIFQGITGVNPTFNSGDTNLLGTLTLQRTEQPTITFTPLQGEQFSKLLMSPIPVSTLALLSSSGWSIERIIRCCVQRINSVPNAPTAAGPTPEAAPEYKEFYRLSQLMRSLQVNGELEFSDNGSGRGLSVRIADNKNESAELADFQSALKVSRTLPSLPAKNSASINRGQTSKFVSTDNSKLTLIPRSLYETLFYLSQGVEAPESDRRNGVVTTTRNPDGTEFDWHQVLNNLIAIHSSSTPPEAAYLCIYYRDSYFFINDNDLSSKATMMLLDQLFSLQSGTPSASSAPALTLNVGH